MNKKNNKNNSDLHRARDSKKDEFYTQLSVIEKELKYYKHHFRDKVVYCNCDDPRSSNFFLYFSHNFETLGIKRLITTCYKSKDINLFSKNLSSSALRLEYNGDKNGDKIPNADEIGVYELDGDGDFRSSECIEILMQADIIVTNPPFSLFREYIDQLIQHGKQFLVLGNVNAITYKEIFQLIKSNQLWLGASISGGDIEFGVPDDYPLKAAGYRIDANGKKYIRVKGIRWFTNMDYISRNEDLILHRSFSYEDFPKYDNYDAIDISKTKNIPFDYDGHMGVPITFLDKYNPEQFEIIRFRKGNDNKDLCINGKCPYFRIIIKKKK